MYNVCVYCAATDDGFVDYSYKHVLPACFIAPLESSFDFNDGHSFLVRPSNNNNIVVLCAINNFMACGFCRL